MANILVIDDDEGIQRLFARLLAVEGHIVRHAASAVHGVMEYEREPSDSILCDFFMDSQNGLETIRELVRKYPKVKIIAMSGGSPSLPDDLLDYAKRFGAVAALHKPVGHHTLLKTVNDVLSM